MGEYIPSAPINDEAKKNNKNLPGMGGVFNPINFHLYHYAGNNPVRYVDPDGRDIRETELTSKSVAVVGAARGSFGFAKDSKGNLAVFIKLEVGVGFGGDIYKFGDIFKIFDAVTDFISDLGTDYDAIDNFISTPDDTGQGNFSDLTNLFEVISFNHEDCSSWNGNLPVEASVLVGANGDKDGNIEVSAGVSAIAAVYLTEETMYINISAFKDLLQRGDD